MAFDVLEANFLLSTPDARTLPPPAYPELAFAGRSNVGKSSLMNALMQRRNLVRTSSTPGATRSIAVFRARLREGPILDLVDLPGYGYAKRSKTERKSWGALIEGYLKHRASLRVVVVIVDARRGLEDDDVELLEFLAHVGREPVVVVTKLDKLPRTRQGAAVQAVAKAAERKAFGVSAVDGTGREELWRAMLRAANVELQRSGTPASADAETPDDAGGAPRPGGGVGSR